MNTGVLKRSQLGRIFAHGQILGDIDPMLTPTFFKDRNVIFVLRKALVMSYDMQAQRAKCFRHRLAAARPVYEEY